MSDDKKRLTKQKTLFNEDTFSTKPFLKWAGGKGQLLNDIERRLPSKMRNSKKIIKYVEPFVGGGAVFFYLRNNYQIKEATLFDINRELIIGYQVIKNNPKELIKKLSTLEKEYHQKEESDRKEFFYSIRDEYNDQLKSFDYQNYNDEWIQRAVYLIYMNKTCFNGLFRLNSKGEFNVPFGKYKNPKICDKENVLQVHQALQEVTILCGDFSLARNYIQKDSFVYFDPPYRPLSSTANFTDYSKDGFSDDEQKRLADFFKDMDKQGAHLMLSNSDPKNENPEDNFFDDLYKNFKIERVKAKRAISCKGSGRGEITELLITNY